jgi:peptidoglycan/LPS O-acetylase OafA/YrhL
MTHHLKSPSDRLHGLDAVRGIALLLGVVLHASLSYFPTAIWVAPDTDNSPVASGLFFVIHLFRMTTFFLVAGLFAHGMLARIGWSAFARNRLKRIAGPLFGLWFVVFPAVVAAVIWAAWVANGGSFPKKASPPPSFSIESFPLVHLWFLWVLLIFYAAALLLRAPFARLDRDGGWARGVDRLMGMLVGPWTPAILAAPLALSLYLLPKWPAFFGIPTPDTGLVPNAAALTGFGLAFAFGFLLDRRRDLLDRIERLWPWLTGLALASGAGAMILAGGPTPSLAPMIDPALKAWTAAVYALAVFASTLALIALALRFLSGHSAIRRYLADASYWIYIVHLPLVMVGQVLLLNVEAPWWVKLSGVTVGVTGAGLVTYELLVRHSFIGAWLNGRRIPWRRPMAAVAAE